MSDESMPMAEAPLAVEPIFMAASSIVETSVSSDASTDTTTVSRMASAVSTSDQPIVETKNESVVISTPVQPDVQIEPKKANRSLLAKLSRTAWLKNTLRPKKSKRVS